MRRNSISELTGSSPFPTPFGDILRRQRTPKFSVRLDDAPAILRETRGVLVAAVVSLRVGLIVIAGDADQKVREVRAGFGPEKKKRSIEGGIGIDVDLFVARLKPALNVWVPSTFEKLSFSRKRVVGLLQVRDRRAHDEGIEDDVLHALNRGASGTIPEFPTPVTKPCEARLGPTPPAGWPTLFASRMKLRRSSLTVVAPNVLVSPRLMSWPRPRVQRVESGNAGAALPGRIGIVQLVVVEEVVRREADPSVRYSPSTRKLPLSSAEPFPCGRWRTSTLRRWEAGCTAADAGPAPTRPAGE